MTDKITLQGSMIVVHGPPGIGKTQLGGKFPGPVKVFATEPGFKYLDESIRKRVTVLPPEADSYDKFLTTVGKLSKNYKTVMLDTVGGLFHICQLHICRKFGVEHPGDVGHGKGWAALRQAFYEMMSKLSWKCEQSGATMFCICHSKMVTVETSTSAFEKISLDLTGQARGVVLPVPDHVWFMGYAEKQAALDSSESKRALYLDGSPGVEAKCRDPRVRTRYIAPLSKTQPYQQILKKLNEGAS